MATKHSLPRNFNEAVTVDDLKWQIGEFVAKLEDYLDSKVDVYIFNSRTTKVARPTFRKGDLVFDFTIVPGIATLQQWDGTKLVKLGFQSLSGPLPQVHNEIPTGAINGINTIFQAIGTYALITTRFFWNGVRQELAVDYSESTDKKTLTCLSFVPTVGDILTLDYNTQ